MNTSDIVQFNLKRIHLIIIVLTLLVSLGFSVGSFVAVQSDHEKRISSLETVSLQRIKILYELKMNMKGFMEKEGYKYESLDDDFEKLFEQSKK